MMVEMEGAMGEYYRICPRVRLILSLTRLQCFSIVNTMLHSILVLHMRRGFGVAAVVAEDPLEGLRKVRPKIGSQQVSKPAEWRVSNPVQLVRWYPCSGTARWGMVQS